MPAPWVRARAWPGIRAKAWLWEWAGRFFWSLVCAVEVLISTGLHCAFGAFIMHCALTKDVLALLPDLPKPFSSSGAGSSSTSPSRAQPSTPSTPQAPTSPFFWPRSPSSGPSYSYLMSCSVLFSSPSTYPFRLVTWLKRSASALSSSLSLPTSPATSPESASSVRTSCASHHEGSSFLYQERCGSSRGRRTSLLQLDVPGIGMWRRAAGLATGGDKKQGNCAFGAAEGTEVSPRGVAEMPPLGGKYANGNGMKESNDSGAGGTVAPIVLLHGIFGFGHGRLGKMSYFGGVERQHEAVYVPDLGSLTSIHDRARRLFYYLKGGTVDYGEEHSRVSGHSRFGPTLPGQHHAWDENNPVHLVGHSAGVQVARLLQQMLADQEFDGVETNADWVASITSLSGALNGTTRVYIDGLSPQDGETMVPVSLLQVLRFGVLLYEWLDLPFFRDYYSFGFGHFNLAWHKAGVRALWDALVRGVTGPFASGDWILPDLSMQRALRLNRVRIRTHPNTYYFSYATVATQQIDFMGRRFVVPAGLSTVHPLFTLRCLQMSLWSFPSSMKPYAGFKDDEWRHNDGALNVVSMLYPMTVEPAEEDDEEGSVGEEEARGEPGRMVRRRGPGRHGGVISQSRRERIIHPHTPMPVVTSTHGAKQTPGHSHNSKGVCSLPSCRGFPVHEHSENQPFSPGVWYYSLLEADHILFVISPRRAGVHFDILYKSIFHRCRSMDSLATSVRRGSSRVNLSAMIQSQDRLSPRQEDEEEEELQELEVFRSTSKDFLVESACASVGSSNGILITCSSSNSSLTSSFGAAVSDMESQDASNGTEDMTHGSSSSRNEGTDDDDLGLMDQLSRHPKWATASMAGDEGAVQGPQTWKWMPPLVQHDMTFQPLCTSEGSFDCQTSPWTLDSQEGEDRGPSDAVWNQATGGVEIGEGACKKAQVAGVVHVGRWDRQRRKRQNLRRKQRQKSGKSDCE